VETEISRASQTARRGTGRYDVEGYLDAIEGVTFTFRKAIEAYVNSGPNMGCWQYARSMAEQIGLIDDMRQVITMDVVPKSAAGPLLAEMLNTQTGVGRLLQDMKRQVTGFAIEAGFSGPDRRVPRSMIAGIHALSDEVCAAVRALVEHCRACCLAEQATGDAESEERVAWYESEADRLSTQMIKTILADDTLTVECKLPLTQLVEEIDRIADYAAAIEGGFQTRCAELAGDADAPRAH